MMCPWRQAPSRTYVDGERVGGAHHCVTALSTAMFVILPEAYAEDEGSAGARRRSGVKLDQAIGKHGVGSRQGGAVGRLEGAARVPDAPGFTAFETWRVLNFPAAPAGTAMLICPTCFGSIAGYSYFLFFF